MTTIIVYPNGKIVIKTKKKHKSTFQWSFTKDSFVEGLMARISTEEQVKVTVKPKTARGHDAAIDGQVELTASDPSVVTVERVDDKSFMVKGVFDSVTSTIPAMVQLVAAFDADLGEGVEAVEFSGVLEVAAPKATTGTIEFGTPEVQP